MARLQFVVNGEVFKTKKSLQERCRSILRATEEISLTDQEFLADLVTRYHPEAELKAGSGISRIYRDSDCYGGLCFWILRVDGTATDFSFMACITHPTAESDAKSAMRTAVLPDIQAFRDSRAAQAHCEFSGELLVAGEIHVDHKPPQTFDAIARDFLVTKGIMWEQVPIEPTLDGVTGNRISDSDFEQDWRFYHRVNAVLRLVPRKSNLSGIKMNGVTDG